MADIKGQLTNVTDKAQALITTGKKAGIPDDLTSKKTAAQPPKPTNKPG